MTSPLYDKYETCYYLMFIIINKLCMSSYYINIIIIKVSEERL